MKQKLTFVLLALSISACALPKGVPTVDARVDAASQYIFRGALQNAEPVLQPSASVRLPLSSTTGIGAGVWTNVNVRDGTGDALLPDGNGQSFSEIDTNATFFQESGGVEYAIGLINYAFPSNTAAIPSLTEAFASAQWVAGGWGNAFAAYYSLNDFSGLYLRADFSRLWKINSRMDFDLGLGLGYSDEKHSLYTYGAQASGLADVSLTGTLGYRLDKRTTASFFVTAVQIAESAIQDGLDALGVETSNLIVGASLIWTY